MSLGIGNKNGPTDSTNEIARSPEPLASVHGFYVPEMSMWWFSVCLFDNDSMWQFSLELVSPP